ASPRDDRPLRATRRRGRDCRRGRRDLAPRSRAAPRALDRRERPQRLARAQSHAPRGQTRMKYFVTVNGRDHEVELVERLGALEVAVDGKPLDFRYEEVDDLGQVVVLRE